MNFGIIGTNFISDRFVEAASRVKDARCVAVYSRTMERGLDFARRHGIPKAYDDLKRMLDDDEVDAIYVASPTLFHKEHTILSLKAGKDVLCEKMIADSEDAFLEMKKASDESGKILVEAMRPDFDPNMDLIISAIGDLGKIRRAHFEYCQYSSRYDKFLAGEMTNAFDTKLKNSSLSDIGIYPLHLCIRIFGNPTEIKSSSVFIRGGFEGMGTAILSYPDMVATVTYSKITESATPTVIDGELGSLVVDRINAPTSAYVVFRNGEKRILPIVPYENNMNFEIEEFIRLSKFGGYEKYLKITEDTMNAVTKIYSSSGVTFPEKV